MSHDYYGTKLNKGDPVCVVFSSKFEDGDQNIINAVVHRTYENKRIVDVTVAGKSLPARVLETQCVHQDNQQFMLKVLTADAGWINLN